MAAESDLYEQIVYNRYRNALIWRNLWSILLFIFGTSVIVFFVAAILFLIKQDWVPGALTVIGTIAQGAALKWVVDRRTDSVTEEKEALDVAKNTFEQEKGKMAFAEVPSKLEKIQKVYRFF
jgi:hypothetical protein